MLRARKKKTMQRANAGPPFSTLKAVGGGLLFSFPLFSAGGEAQRTGNSWQRRLERARRGTCRVVRARKNRLAVETKAHRVNGGSGSRTKTTQKRRSALHGTTGNARSERHKDTKAREKRTKKKEIAREGKRKKGQGRENTTGGEKRRRPRGVPTADGLSRAQSNRQGGFGGWAGVRAGAGAFGVAPLAWPCAGAEITSRARATTAVASVDRVVTTDCSAMAAASVHAATAHPAA